MRSFQRLFTRLIAPAIIGLISLFSQASAITVGTVGSVDNYLGSCAGPSGDANEIACIESFAGPGTVTAIQKFSASPGGGELLMTLEAVTLNDLTPVSDTFALALPSDWQGGYFLLKTGNLTPGPGGPTILSYVFENLSSAAYAVFNLNDADFPFDIGQTGKISHITAIQVSAVPLPAAAWMFLTALGGIFGLKRIRKTV